MSYKIPREDKLLFELQNLKDINEMYIYNILSIKNKNKYKNKILIKDITQIKYDDTNILKDNNHNCYLVKVNYNVIGNIYDKDTILTVSINNIDKDLTKNNHIVINTDDYITLLVNITNFDLAKGQINNNKVDTFQIIIDDDPIYEKSIKKLKFTAKLI